MNYCVPDLPFLQTVLWYFKQVAAVALIIAAVLCLYLGGLLVTGMLQRSRSK